MTYYLYVQPDGHPDVLDHKLRLELFPGYVLLETSETMPDVKGKRYVDGKWVRVNPTPQYALDRRAEYPNMGDQLDALWHAMDDGLIPKIEPMYSDILAIKQAYPKPSN